MADKLITELSLITSVSNDVNFAVDDSIQSYRATAVQLYNYLKSFGLIDIYDSTFTYTNAQYCLYLGVIYKSIANTNINFTPSSSPTKWTALSKYNNTLHRVPSLYDSAITYDASDWCVYAGIIYKSIDATNTANTPSSSPTKWMPLIQTSHSALINNIGLAFSKGSNALTISLRDKDGSAHSATSPGDVAFRSSTISSGTYSILRQTSALSDLVVTSGATLGHISAVACYLYVYLINNAGAMELAVSSSRYDDGSVVTTTLMDATSDSRTAIYSTTARSSVALRLIGRMKSTQTTAGTWAADITEVTLMPFILPSETSEVLVYTGNGHGNSAGTKVRRFSTISKNIGSDISYADSVSAGAIFTIVNAGLYWMQYRDRRSGSQERIGITRNCAAPSTSLATTPLTEIIDWMNMPQDYPFSVQATTFCDAGDLIRPMTEAGANDNVAGVARFHIMKVSR